MTRIHRYILSHDGGMAPCPEAGLITLGTCKPVIRRCAHPGDWVLGFRPGSLSRGLALWAGKVDRKLGHGEYQHAHPKRTLAPRLRHLSNEARKVGSICTVTCSAVRKWRFLA